MRIALVHSAVLPVGGYGGTERVVWWLAKGLWQLGHEVVLVAKPGSQCPYAKQVVLSAEPYAVRVKADVVHYFHTPPEEPRLPYVVTIGGNAQAGERFLINTIFVSRNHAERHSADAFVHNGVDPDDYLFSQRKEPHLLFLSKAAWKVKNVKGAIRIARKAGRELHVLGGRSWFLQNFKGVHWHGTIGGVEKAVHLSRCQALLFPVIWHEPFGLVVVESLVSGTPVLATPFGSLPELINTDVGKLCSTESEFIDALGDLGKYSAERCREYAVEHFSHRKMAENYLKRYELVGQGRVLNRSLPKHTEHSLMTESLAG